MFNQIFRFAKRKGYISDPLVIAIPSSRQNSRPDISETEWRTLYTYLRKYVKEAQDKRRHRERFYLQHYILILANSGIRVGEARHLRWRDISSTKTLSGQKRLIFTVRGKTGEREVVCNETVERYVERLRNFRSEEAKRLNLEEPIFCHPNGRPIGSFKKGFEQALNEAGVLRGSDGKKRVPYSLRHTYATMRISKGVSVFQLAANMGTSVEMIESFYGKKRMRDPKMATEVTKFRDGDGRTKLRHTISAVSDLYADHSVGRSITSISPNAGTPVHQIERFYARGNIIPTASADARPQPAQNQPRLSQDPGRLFNMCREERNGTAVMSESRGNN